VFLFLRRILSFLCCGAASFYANLAPGNVLMRLRRFRLRLLYFNKQQAKSGETIFSSNFVQFKYLLIIEIAKVMNCLTVFSTFI
jgi:hypothetical protein